MHRDDHESAPTRRGALPRRVAVLLGIGFVAGAAAIGGMTLLLKPSDPPTVEPIELKQPAAPDRSDERRDRLERRKRAERRARSRARRESRRAQPGTRAQPPPPASPPQPAPQPAPAPTPTPSPPPPADDDDGGDDDGGDDDGGDD